MKQRFLTNEEIGSLAMALSHLLHSGIGFGDALMLLGSDERDQRCKERLQTMAAGVDEGNSLAQVFRDAACFPEYVCTLITVGETAGRLEEALDALAHYYQNRARLAARLRSAVVYPVALLLVLLTVMTVLLVWVLPVFDQVYAQLGSGLTGLGGSMLALGMGIKKLLPLLLAAGILLVLLMVIPGIRNRLLDGAKKIWGDRGVFGKINRARFVQALSMAFSSGMTAEDAAKTAAELSDSPAFRARCGQCCAALGQGTSVAKALGETQLLSRAHCRLLEAGERSGRGALVLEQLADLLLEESEADLERQAGKIEPIMVVTACVLIGGVLLAVLLPLVHIMSAIG